MPSWQLDLTVTKKTLTFWFQKSSSNQTRRRCQSNSWENNFLFDQISPSLQIDPKEEHTKKLEFTSKMNCLVMVKRTSQFHGLEVSKKSLFSNPKILHPLVTWGMLCIKKFCKKAELCHQKEKIMLIQWTLWQDQWNQSQHIQHRIHQKIYLFTSKKHLLMNDWRRLDSKWEN